MIGLAAILAAIGLTGPMQAPRRADLAISANLPQGVPMTQLGKQFTDLHALGVQLMYLSYKWSDLEKQPGHPNVTEIRNGIRGLGSLGYRIAITIQTLDTNNRTLPADLQDKPFGSAEMRQRFDAILSEVAKEITPTVRCVMLANEADIYLAQHRSELEPFAGFAEQGRTHLRALKPGLPVGVTTTYDGVRDRPEIARRLNRDMDVVTLTYYPLDSSFRVRPVTDIPADFARMVRAAGNKPLMLQEVGYPADPLLGSSEEKQAAFVETVFDEMHRYANRIGFLNFFLLHDFSSDLVDTFLNYYRLPDPRFRAYLATLGLKRADGTPRKAWARFQARAKEWAAGR